MVQEPSPEPVSKTRQKQQADALQKLGVKLSALSAAQRQKLALPARLEQALMEYQAIRSHGAKRRQSQLIGKLMRAADYERIAEGYAELMAEQQGQSQAFHLAEYWREQLISQPASLTAFIAQFSPTDIQALRQLIKKAQDDRRLEKNSGAAKALFRMIKDQLA
ncbi:MAG: DUF615 domain-containing protein [Legionellaceae bacterium]|nr:DUF615 domain-containing protein [Legionellaceae bacterium]